MPYLTQRLTDDPHVWASALYDEIGGLGYPLSYPSFTRGMRARALRPHCEACSGVKGRPTIEIDHPAGEEGQWDWLELPDAPWGGDAHLLVGSLPCSGKFRAVFCECEEQAYLVEGIDAVLRRLGGTPREWRFDRMATVVDPRTGVVQRSFAPVAAYYAVKVVVCPPRRGNRKGSVEKSNHYATGRFWRTMTADTMIVAQAQLDRFCERIADRRPRPPAALAAIVGENDARAYLERVGRSRPTVADLASFEPLVSLPAEPYPAMKSAESTVGQSALVAFEGNRYSVAPGLTGAEVAVTHRLGSNSVEIRSRSGALLGTHRRAVPHSGQVVRDPEHRRALEQTVLGAFNTDAPCRRKENRPPSAAARAEAAKLLSGFEDSEVVVSLADYQAIVDAEEQSEGLS